MVSKAVTQPIAQREVCACATTTSLFPFTSLNIADEAKVPLATALEDDTEDSLEEKETGKEIGEVKEGRQKLESEKGGLEPIPEEALATEAVSLQDTIAVTGDISCDTSEEKKVNVTTCASLKKVICEKYKVWRPKKRPHLPDLVKSSKESHERQQSKPASPLDQSASISLLLRQQQLLDRVEATQAVLTESTDEILGSPGPTTKKSHMSFKDASRRVISDQRRQSRGYSRLSDIVTQYQEKLRREKESPQLPQTPKTPLSARFPPWHSTRGLYKQPSIIGAIPIDEWYELVAENQGSLGDDVDRKEK